MLMILAVALNALASSDPALDSSKYRAAGYYVSYVRAAGEIER